MDSPTVGTGEGRVCNPYACQKHGIRKSACSACVYEEALSVIENARKDPMSSIEELDMDEAILKQAQGQFCPGHNRLRCTECNWFVRTNLKNFAWDTAVKYTNFSGRICQHKVWKINCPQAGCNPKRLCVCGQWKKKYHVCEASAAAARAAIESVALPAGSASESQSTAQVSVEKMEKKSKYKTMSAEQRKAFNLKRKERKKELKSMGKPKKTGEAKLPWKYQYLPVEQKKAFCRKVYETRKRRFESLSEEDRNKILERRKFTRQERRRRLRESRDGADTAHTASSDHEKVDFEGKKGSPQLSDEELSENHLGEEMMGFSADYIHLVETEQTSSETRMGFMELSQEDINDEFETFLTTLASQGDSAPASGGD
jgi:hypothetical protein